MLLDCGPGVFAKLRALRRLRRRRRGGDHATCTPTTSSTSCRTPPGCATRRASSRSRSTAARHRRPARPRLLAPPGALRGVRRHVSARGMTRRPHRARLRRDASTTRPTTLAIGGLTRALPARPALHPGQRRRVRRRTARGSRSPPTAARTRSCATFAAGTDLLLIEATLPRPERDGERGHLTPAEAGEHGARAGAKRLVLTHFSDELDVEWARAEARAGVRRAGRRRPRRRGLRRSASKASRRACGRSIRS